MSDARDQANAYRSVFADRELRFDDDSTMRIPPHPRLRMMDDDALAAYDEYLAEIETYDRHPDIYIPEQKVKDRDGNEMVLPAETKQGDVKGPPFFKDRTLVSPPHEIRIVQVVLGDEKYSQLRAKTIDGRPAAARDVWQAWNDQSVEIARRADADPKSDGSAGDLADPPAPDSE